MKLKITMLVATASIALSASETRIKMKDLPEAVQKSVKEQTKKSELREVEEAVAFDSIPEAARKGLQQKAGSGKILSVECVTKGSIVSYEAVVVKRMQGSVWVAEMQVIVRCPG